MAKVKRADFSRRGKWLNLLFVGFFVYLSVVLIRQQFTLVGLQDQYAGLEQEVSAAEKYNQRLKAHAEALLDDFAYIEAVIRKELGMIREGETVYILPRR